MVFIGEAWVGFTQGSSQHPPENHQEPIARNDCGFTVNRKFSVKYAFILGTFVPFLQFVGYRAAQSNYLNLNLMLVLQVIINTAGSFFLKVLT